jgi:hypothetical protein
VTKRPGDENRAPGLSHFQVANAIDAPPKAAIAKVTLPIPETLPATIRHGRTEWRK